MISSQMLLAFLAGNLTTLSPCVLPVLPFILGSSGMKNKCAPFLVALGVFVSLTSVGWGLAAFGDLVGLDAGVAKTVGAVLMGLFGILLLSSKASNLLSLALQKFTLRAQTQAQSIELESPKSQILLGLLLGIAWTPCSGPTLGSAMVLASQTDGRWQSFLTMAAFGIGAIAPMMIIASGAGPFLRKHQNQILTSQQRLKRAMGVLMLAVSLLMISGWDRSLEAKITEILPDAWVDLTTRY